MNDCVEHVWDDPGEPDKWCICVNCGRWYEQTLEDKQEEKDDE